MKNFLKYFYGIDVDKITFNKYYYQFTYNNYEYKLYIITEDIDINFIASLNNKLLENTLVSQLIINKDNKYISFYNWVKYILIKIFVNNNIKNILDDICKFDSVLYINNINIDWGKLWSKKIDYLENLINENGKRYPLISDSFNYFVGMTENAISYYNDIDIPQNINYYISHKSIKLLDFSDAIYNPLNIIFDYKARDIAEYIKNAFFVGNNNIFKEIGNLINKNYLTLVDVKLIISRILYPSFYFDFYENILLYNDNEKILVNIINRLNEYEIYLSNVITFFKKYYDIEEINWLKSNK